MCRSQPLLLLIFLVVFACNGVNAAKLPSTGSNEDLAQLPELERETRLSPQPAVNSDILLIYDKMVFLRLCLTYIKSCKISVLGFSGGVLYEWTVDFTLVGIYCQDIVIRVFERNTTYNLSIVYYDDSGNSVTEEQKTIVTGLDSCPVACVYGEPHFRTYDGFRYPYQGDEGCLITLTMDCREREKGTLTVQIDLEKSPLSTDASLKTRLKSVRILAYGRLYRMMKGGIVQVSFGDDLGGKSLSKDKSTPTGTVTVTTFPYHAENVTVLKTILLTYEDGAQVDHTIHFFVHGYGIVEFNGKFRLYFFLTDPFWLGGNKICGMFGTPDSPSNVANDFLLKNGTNIPTSKGNAEAFGDNWTRFCPS